MKKPETFDRAEVATLLAESDYAPPALIRGGHLQTVYPSLFRKVKGVNYTRERIDTPDGDFLDLDWSETDGDTKGLGIICHGLEGHSERYYMRGMSKALNLGGWDALAWNYRCCSGEPNRTLRFYHNGATDDLETVIKHALNSRGYDKVALVGFSLGGNLVLNHLGRTPQRVDPKVRGAVVVCPPCHIKSSAGLLAKKSNYIYMKRFLLELRRKIRWKMEQWPGHIDDRGYGRIKDFKQFDDRYTAPLHGFKDAEDYWERCSTLDVIKQVEIPTLILSSMNDPFLSDMCYPSAQVKSNPNMFLKTTKDGGHCGYVSRGQNGVYWSEELTTNFLNLVTD